MPLASSVCRCESSRLRQAKRTSKHSAMLGRFRIRSRAAPPLTVIAALTTSNRVLCSLTGPRLGRHDKGLRSFNSRAVGLSHTHGRRGFTSTGRLSGQHHRCIRSHRGMVGRASAGGRHTGSQRSRTAEPASHRQSFRIRAQHADGRNRDTSSHSHPIQRFHWRF